MDPKQILEQMNAAIARARAIIDAADKAAGGPNKGVLTADQQAQVDAAYADYDKLKASYDAAMADQRRRDRLVEHDHFMNESAGRRTGGSTGAAGDTRPEQPLEFALRGRTIRCAPGSAEFVRASTEYRRAFGDYLMTGINAGMMTGDNSKGGYLAPTQLAAGLIQALDDSVFMRQLATVLPPLTSAVSLGVVSLDADPDDADWTAEVPAADISEDDKTRLGKREFAPQLLTKLVKLSLKLIRTATMDPETLLRNRMVHKFAITEEKNFLTGDGKDKPLGVFTASNDGIPTTRDVVCASQTVFTPDEVNDVFYSLKEAYRSRATWLAHREWIKRFRKFKTGDGAYMWQPQLAADQPQTVLGRPVIESEVAPSTFASAQYIAIIGDFKAGYWIVDSLQLEIQRLNELFALKNQVGLLARKETDGAPVLAEAFARMRLA